MVWVNNFRVDDASAIFSVLEGEMVKVLPWKILVRCVGLAFVLLLASAGIFDLAPMDPVDVIEVTRSGRARVVVGLTTVRVVAVEDTLTMVAPVVVSVPWMGVGLFDPRCLACSLAFI